MDSNITKKIKNIYILLIKRRHIEAKNKSKVESRGS